VWLLRTGWTVEAPGALAQPNSEQEEQANNQEQGFV
jgi:hypothetical protein